MMGLQALRYFGDACNKNTNFFGLPTWYKYLPVDPHNDALGNCKFLLTDDKGQFILSNLWLIGLALIEILIRVAAIMTIGYIVYGGVLYITSQGEPDRLQKARSTIINGLIGLVIAIAAITLVSFGSRLFT